VAEKKEETAAERQYTAQWQTGIEVAERRQRYDRQAVKRWHTTVVARLQISSRHPRQTGIEVAERRQRSSRQAVKRPHTGSQVAEKQQTAGRQVSK
jgi:hypothetical protein